VDREKYVLHVLGVSSQRATHIRLVKGTVKRNPHTRVLCPTLAQGGVCHRGGKHPYQWLRPKLLIKNYGNPRLQLWMCEGCRDKFLLRVEQK
jgi:hypothetical protein